MGFIWSQLFVRPTYPTESFEGQTLIVTGSNVGLGLEAARHCVRLNAKKVILAVRNLEAGNEAKENIEKSCKRTGVCEVWKLDLSSYDSVKAFAARASKELDRVDVLLENAGVISQNFRLTEDHETMVTVNVISTILLALLMLPKLQESAQRYNTKPRLVIVSSEVHAWTSFKERDAEKILEELNNEKTANMKERYSTSKLLEVLLVRQIAPMISQSKNKDVILNMLNPGLCHSSLARDVENWVFWAMKQLLARTTEVGGRTLVASAAAGPESHGKYMSDGIIHDDLVVGWVKTDEGKKIQAKLWDEASQVLERISPGILENLK